MSSATRRRICTCKAFSPSLAISCFFFTAFASAQQPQPSFQDELLNHHQGTWILHGTIAGKPTTHDVTADWVLNHQYLRIHETSREKNAKGEPAYEAMVFVGWDAVTSRYFAIWHDVWGGFGAASIGYAPRSGDEIRFLFKNEQGKDDFHTTFAYNRSADTWDWRMDNDDNGILKPFARVALNRAQTETQNSASDREAATPMHITGPFDVKVTPQDDKTGDSKLGRMTLDKQYHGDLEATATGQMLTAATDVKGSAGYVAIEKVTGNLKGRNGSFILQHSGTMSGGKFQLIVTVVPDSGTGQLAGITGKMNINIAADGNHSYDFEYMLPAQ